MVANVVKAVEAVGVTYVYPDGTVGIRNVNLSVENGEKVAIVGANGSGKSTLIHVLSGLIKPTEGVVRILGVEVDGNFEYVRRNVGVVFQNPDDFLFNPTVRDELLYTPAQLEIPYDEALKLMKDYAKIFEIEHILDKPPFRLSGGEKKRVEIACVMMLKPKILFMDEPTANVDGRTRRKIIRFARDYEGTLVLATHDLSMIPDVADKVVVLNLKKEVEAVGGVELLEDEDLLERCGVI
ncbi:energy-coupling factor ABC transporter ATP-binding protein [Archaeoglobus sp.]